MGFMDKAKQMADQAQAKIEDAQKQFNDGQAQKGGQQGDNVTYDAHGRPIAQDGPAAARTPPAPVTPGQSPQAADPAPTEDLPPVDSTPAPTPTAEGVNASPDPFKPIQ